MRLTDTTMRLIAKVGGWFDHRLKLAGPILPRVIQASSPPRRCMATPLGRTDWKSDSLMTVREKSTAPDVVLKVGTSGSGKRLGVCRGVVTVTGAVQEEVPALL